MSENTNWFSHALQKPGTRLFLGAVVVLVIVAAAVLVLQFQSGPTTPGGSTAGGGTTVQVAPITNDEQANEKMDEISNNLIAATSEIDNLIGTIGQ